MEPSQLSDGGYKETEKKKVEEDPLEQQFKNLQQEWSSFKQSNRRSGTTDVSRCSSDDRSTTTTTTTTTIVNEDYFEQVLLNKSPRDPMSSLQRDDQKQHDWAVAVLLKERWDAIQSSRLRGRRLFEEEEESGGGGESDHMCRDHDQTDEDISGECFDPARGSENASLVSYGSDDEYNHGGKYCQAALGLDYCYCSSLSCSSWSEEEKAEESQIIEETEELEMQAEAEGGVCGGIRVGNGGYRKLWMMIVTWFGVPLVTLVVLGIISRKYGDQKEVIDRLVPT